MADNLQDTGKGLLDIGKLLLKLGIKGTPLVSNLEILLGRPLVDVDREVNAITSGTVSLVEAFKALGNEIKQAWENTESYQARIATAQSIREQAEAYDRAFNAKIFHNKRAHNAGYITSEALQYAFGEALIKGAVKAGTKVVQSFDVGKTVEWISAITPLVKQTAQEGRVGKELYKFTGTAAKKMERVERAIPIQIIDEIINHPIAVTKDPQGTKALMYYAQLWRNGKLYNVEVLYEQSLNQIKHFLYTEESLGPLLKLNK